LAGGNAANVNWISKNAIDNNNVDHTAIVAYLKNDIMRMGKFYRTFAGVNYYVYNMLNLLSDIATFSN